MARLLAALLLLAGPLARAKTPPPPKEEVKLFDSAADALRDLLTANPRVVAFGEYHEKKGAAPVASAIARFTRELLDVMRESSSDIVVETWVTEGNCGKQETKVVAEVAETTQRPATTESEVVTLIKRAKSAGLQPHILQLTCKEYNGLLGKDGEVDYMKLLALITRGLQNKVTTILTSRGATEKRVLVYGGALHNDLFPRKELAPYSFAPTVVKASKGHYLEVDLFVPEYVEKDDLLSQEKWFPLWKENEKPGQVVLIQRGPSSAMIFFPRTPRPPAVVTPPDGGTRSTPPSR